jgi:hypothetical protein
VIDTLIIITSIWDFWLAEAKLLVALSDPEKVKAIRACFERFEDVSDQMICVANVVGVGMIWGWYSYVWSAMHKKIRELNWCISNSKSYEDVRKCVEEKIVRSIELKIREGVFVLEKKEGW